MRFSFTRRPTLARIVQESVVKNVMALGVVFLLTPAITAQLKAVLRQDNVGNFLLLLSILLVTVCFANFAFSYEQLPRVYQQELKMLAHVTTFIFMLLIALLLAAVTLAILIVYPAIFFATLVFNLLLYLGMALYDLWDSIRMLNRQR